MFSDVARAKSAVEDDIRDRLDHVFEAVTDGRIPDYQLYIWGSTIEEGKNPDDLDLIVGYAGDTLSDDKKKSIESWVKESVGSTHGFESVDIAIVHKNAIQDLIGRSRVSRIYCVDTGEWKNF